MSDDAIPVQVETWGEVGPRFGTNLMGVHEIGQRLGVSHQGTEECADFPGPVASLHEGRVWLTEDVEGWISANRPHLAAAHG